MDKNEKIVRVKPYPFPIMLMGGAQPSQAEVLRLAQHGAVVRLAEQVLTVGTEFPVEFDIPVLKNHLQLTAKVMKTYDRAHPNGGAPERMAEIHFKGIRQEQVNQIYKFLMAIRQVD